jgi:hypothetical protein
MFRHEQPLQAVGCSRGMRQEPDLHGRWRGVAWKVPEELQRLRFIDRFALFFLFPFQMQCWRHLHCLLDMFIL